MTNTANDPLSAEPGSGVPQAGSGVPQAGEPPFGRRTSGAPGAAFFDAVRRLGVVRLDDGRMLAGVAAGIARRYGLDPVLVRIGFVALTFLGGLGIALYGLGWMFLPHPDGRIHAQQVLTGTVTAGFAGAALTLFVTMHDLAPLLVVALVAYLIVRNQRSGRQSVA